jgi:L-threonylcarbamoyladenylate synthase
MSPVFDCRDETQLLTGMRHARQAIGRGELVVLPTDTVYGVAADAFSAKAVQRLLDAKGRGRQSPPPVLVAGVATLRALVAEVPEAVERLVEAFWPGGLTIVLPSQPSLSWDLGDTHGTVAVRMPANNLALELLEETGPLAVSSANLTGKAAAIMASDARDMLGDSVAVYLDGGPSTTGVASTIIDATSLVSGGAPLVRVLREGAVDRAALREVIGDLLEPDPDPNAGPHSDPALPGTDAARPDTDPAQPDSEPKPDAAPVADPRPDSEDTAAVGAETRAVEDGA